MNRPELSILLIARDEARRLPAFFAALRELPLRHEVLVLENGSRDGTAALARRHGARVFQVRWRGYARTKNAGFRLARAPWILSLDADENPDRELCRDVAAAVRRGDKDCYEVDRLNYFLGRPVWHGGWRPDWQLRLFRKGKARFNSRLVHEGLVPHPTARLGRLRGLLHHHSYPDLSGYLERLDRYTTLQAQELMKQKGPRPGLALRCMLLRPAWTFFRMYLLRLGLLEGKRGLALALLSASASFWKFAKYWHRSWAALGGKAGRPWVEA